MPRAVVKRIQPLHKSEQFDASSHRKICLSLNECLPKVKQALLQISVCERDRNYLKFLWMEDGDHYKLKAFPHSRVVFRLTSIPFLLSATLKYHLSNTPPSF